MDSSFCIDNLMLLKPNPRCWTRMQKFHAKLYIQDFLPNPALPLDHPITVSTEVMTQYLHRRVIMSFIYRIIAPIEHTSILFPF